MLYEEERQGLRRKIEDAIIHCWELVELEVFESLAHQQKIGFILTHLGVPRRTRRYWAHQAHEKFSYLHPYAPAQNDIVATGTGENLSRSRRGVVV